MLRSPRFRVDDLIPLHVGCFPASGFGVEGTKPVRSLLTTVHRFFALPMGHYKYIAVLALSENQQPLETVKPLECRQDLLLPSAGELALQYVADEPGGEVRYRMLEPVRQYAREKLEESGEARTVGRSHATFFLALAERAYHELIGARQVEWLDRLDRENGNLGATMSWALNAGAVEIGVRLGWALWLFWTIRGYQHEGRRWMEAVLERRDLSPALRAKALVAAASLAYGYGDYEWCERYSEEGLDLSRRVGDKLGMAWAHFGLGVVAMSRTDHAAATPHVEESLRSFREINEDLGVARATTCLGMVALMRGDVSLATETFEEGLAVARRIGDRSAVCITLYNLAQVALCRGDHDHAAALFEEGVTLSERMGDRANVAYCLEGLATVAGTRGQVERSARLLGTAEGLLKAVRVPVYTYYKPDPSLYERAMTNTRLRLGAARFERVRTEGRAMTFEQAVEYALKTKKPHPNRRLLG